MSDAVQIKIHNKDKLKASLKGLEKVVSGNVRTINAGVAAILYDHTMEVFESEGAAGSGKWLELKDSTMKNRRRRGQENHPILMIRGMAGGLKGEIMSESDENAAQVGVAGKDEFLGHARAHQFGTDKAGKNRDVEIPARSFLVLTDRVKKEIKEEVRDQLKDGLGKIT